MLTDNVTDNVMAVDRNDYGFPKRNRTCQWRESYAEFFTYHYDSDCDNEHGAEYDIKECFTFCPFCGGEIEWT